MPSTRYSLGMPIRLPRMSPRQRRLEIRHRQVGGGRILRIVPGHGPQQDRRVAHRLGHRPGLVERRGEGDDAPARAAPIGRLDPDDAGEGRRLADRAAGVGAGRRQAEVRRHRRRRAARGAARRQGRRIARPPPGSDRRAVGGGLVGRAHGELVHVELAEHHRARSQSWRGDRALVGRHEPLEDARRRLARHAFGAEQVLDPERDAAQIRRVARRQPRVRRAGLRPRALGRVGD